MSAINRETTKSTEYEDIKNHLTDIFSGHYLFERKINNPEIVMKGEANFIHESDNRIFYTESGVYFLNDKKYEFYQKRYFYFKDLFLYIYTMDKKILHKIMLSEIKEPHYAFEHSHQCKNDKYLLRFYFEQEEISMKYEVRGSFKDYNIDTRFRRKNI